MEEYLARIKTTSAFITTNIAPIRLSQEQMEMGRIEYENEDKYSELRTQYQDTHVLRFDKRDGNITNIAIAEGQRPIGKVGKVSLLNDTPSLQIVAVDEQLQATVVHVVRLGERERLSNKA